MAPPSTPQRGNTSLGRDLFGGRGMGCLCMERRGLLTSTVDWYNDRLRNCEAQGKMEAQEDVYKGW